MIPAATQNEELDAGPRKVAPGAERFCAATGVVTPVDVMIRFVVGPDGNAVPDLKRKLPGRGLWVTATREALKLAVSRKAFARGFKRQVTAGPELVDGTEQLLVQRLLAAKNERQSRAALLSSWVVIFIQFTLFLIVGVCLFTLYKDNGWTPPAVTDSIYPRFIWDQLPPGLSGLIIAAILAAAMSNLSAALNSLTPSNLRSDAASALSTGKGTPITPVELTNTSDGRHPK